MDRNSLCRSGGTQNYYGSSSKWNYVGGVISGLYTYMFVVDLI